MGVLYMLLLYWQHLVINVVVHVQRRLHLQHRLVLELSVGLSFDQRQAQWRIDLFLAAATSIVSTILPITGAEPALFGVYAVDLLSRWRALRGIRKTLEDDHD